MALSLFYPSLPIGEYGELEIGLTPNLFIGDTVDKLPLINSFNAAINKLIATLRYIPDSNRQLRREIEEMISKLTAFVKCLEHE